MSGRGISALALGLLGCAADTPAVPVPHVPDDWGPHQIGHSTFDAKDPVRADRVLRIDVWYPIRAASRGTNQQASYLLGSGISIASDRAYHNPAGTLADPSPLLVFSHGYQAINTQSTALMEALASHGFVVASPEHTGNSQEAPDDDFDTAAGHRVPDVSLVIDVMHARSADDGDLLAGTVDPSLVGVLGHSFGGMTSVGVAAGWAGAAPDDRVDAILPISAVIEGTLQATDRPSPNAGFSTEALAAIDIPTLLLGGTADADVPIANNDIAFEAMTGAPAVYAVDIVGANHTHFANVCVIGDHLIDLGLPQTTWATLGAEDLLAPYEATCTGDAFPYDEAVRLTNLYAVAFFRRHLFGEEAYDAYLDEAYAETEPAVEIRVRTSGP